MKVLVFTSLFPNNVWPLHGVFILERMTRVAALPGLSLRVVAPVPYFPPVKLGARWLYSQVARAETIEGLPVTHPRYFMIPKIATGWHGPLMARALLPYVKSLRASFDFDVIDAHYVYPDGYAAVEIGRALGVPVVVSARGSDINLFREIPSARPHLVRTLERASGLIAVSEALARAMRELGAPPGKVRVIPNGVDARKFHPVPRDTARERTGSRKEGRLVLAVGHLTQNKGFDRVLGAFRGLLNLGGYDDVRVAIVGEGVYRRELERLVGFYGLGDRVRLAGQVPHADLHLWYGAADLSCLFSRREGWPNVVLESMACGTPVLATPVGGVPEIIGNGPAGVLAEGDDDALARALAAALDRAWDREAIARFAEKHTWERAADSVREVLASVVAGAGVPA
jgi:glycosyltransferase involved in cell wall biosynthesis